MVFLRLQSLFWKLFLEVVAILNFSEINFGNVENM